MHVIECSLRSPLPTRFGPVQLLFPASQNVSKMMNAYDSWRSVVQSANARNYNNNTLQGANFQHDLSPPGYVDRSFTHKPREEHAGGLQVSFMLNRRPALLWAESVRYHVATEP